VARDLARLVGGVAAAWLVTAVPAHLLGVETALPYGTVAALLCLVPAAATLLWAHRSFAGSPEAQLAAVLGGTAVRMLVVIGAGMAVYHAAPGFHRASFWFWVIGFYLATLALEVVLVVGRHPADGPHAP
jgi:hypothetical protein